MTPRDTSTGAVLEAMILPALERGGYAHRGQVVIGARIGGRPHKVDAIATKGERSVLVSLKWQQVGGTAEQKVPFAAGGMLRRIWYSEATAGPSGSSTPEADSESTSGMPTAWKC
jgi:hypothetical protein